MSLNQGWRLVLDADATDETFDVEGSEILALSTHSGGTWVLDLLMPDGSVIPLRTFDADGTQQIFAPRGTRVRLHGGSQGAKAWVGTYDSTPSGRLL